MPEHIALSHHQPRLFYDIGAGQHRPLSSLSGPWHHISGADTKPYGIKTLAAQGEFESSLIVLEQAGESNLRDSAVLAARGKVLLGVHRAGEAIEVFTVALDRHPEMVDLRGWLALSYVTAHQPDRAATVLKPVIQGSLQEANRLPVLVGLLAAGPSLKDAERKDIFSSCVAQGAEVPKAAKSLYSSWIVWGHVIPLHPKLQLLEVEARSTPAVGEWAKMSVAIGKKGIITIEVKSESWHRYRIPLEPYWGAMTLRLSFDNDFYIKDSGEDRNLFIRAVRLRCL